MGHIGCITFNSPPPDQYAYTILWSLQIKSTIRRNLTSKGGDNMIIDFDEQKFKNEIKSIVKQYGASSSDAKMVVSLALSAVRKASKPVNL